MRNAGSPVMGADSHVKVWDFPTRVFHWTVVSLVLTSWITADQGFMKLHLWSGSILLVALIFRIAWGVIGSTTARFIDFIAPPRRVWSYLRALVTPDKPLYAGHNPAGGWMVVALVTLLSLQIATGLFANDGLKFNAPFATLVDSELSDRLTQLHGELFNFILLLVYFHVVAVFFYFWVKGENLIGPMLHGKKHRAHVPPDLNLRFTRSVIALALLTLSAGLVWWILRP